MRFFANDSKNGLYFNSERGKCVSQASFGQSCTQTSQCLSGLICGLNGAVKNICLKTFGEKCGSINECVNQVGCFNGVCGCNVKLNF